MFCKRAGAALLFGSILFTTVNSAAVCAVADDKKVAKSQTSSKNIKVGNEGSGVGSLAGGIGNADKALYGGGGTLLGLTAGAVAGYCSKKYSSNKVDDGNNNDNNNTYSETEKEKKSDNDQKSVVSAGGKLSVLDFLGAVSYLLNCVFGIGSDIKIDSELNKEKLKTVVVIHSIGIIVFIFYIIFVDFSNRLLYMYKPFKKFLYMEMACYFLCPVAGMFLHFFNSYLLRNGNTSSEWGDEDVSEGEYKKIKEEDKKIKEENMVDSVNLLVNNLQDDLNNYYGKGRFKVNLEILS